MPSDLTPADNTILFAVHRLRYVRPDQLRKALYKDGSQSYAEKNLKRLGDDEGGLGYLKRDWVSSKGVRGRGSRPSFYYLSTKGYTHLSKLRPDRVQPKRIDKLKNTHIDHDLDITELLVKAVMLTRRVPGLRIAQGFHEQELREMNMQVQMRDGRSRTVTPDSFLDVTYGDRRLCVAWEVERTMRDMPRWIEKIEGLAAWNKSSDIHRLFRMPGAVVCFVATDDEYYLSHQETLLRNTEKALTKLGLQNWAHLFLVWGGKLKDVDPLELFTQPVWRQPFREEPVVLWNGLAELVYPASQVP